MSLYALDGHTRQLLGMKNFESPDFSVKSFIEQLSGSQRHLDEDQRLDPKPYIRTFELAAKELTRLHDVALGQEESASINATELAEARNNDVQNLAAQVKECVKEVKALDEVSSEIQQSSGPLGHKLESMSLQHQQISNYRMLTTAYLTFLAGRQPMELTRMWSQDVRKCAKFVADLQGLAMAIGPLNGKKDAQAQIDKFAENLENQLLSNFLDSYQNFDLSGMRESADILTDFNGGGAVTQAYINQHRFFMNVDQLQPSENEDEDSDAIWRQLGHYKLPYDDFVALIDRSVREIGETIARETEIITKVFPKPADVLSLFIQRTFAQKIQEIVNKYMDEAAQVGTIAQVRVLGVCYSRINALVNDLQNTWSEKDSGLSDAEQHELSATLESNLLDAFVLYLDDYFDLEKQNLAEIIDAEFQTGTDQNGISSTTGTVTEDGRMDRLRKAMRNLTHDDPEDDTPSKENSPAGTPIEPLGPGAQDDPDGYASARSSRWSRLQHMPSEGVHNVLAAFGEAIAREQILRRPANFAADATALYNLLTRELGGRYISATIDHALAHSLKIEAKYATNWSFIESIKTSGHALRLLSAFVKTVLFAMVQEHPQTQQNMADALNTYILNVQRSCLHLMEQSADIMHLRTRYLLSRNSKRDFVEPPGGSAGSVISVEILHELQAFETAVKSYLSIENSQRILRLVSINLCDDLLNHVRQYTISIEGGMALSNDINKLDDLVSDEFTSARDVADKFATLKAITKLYSSEQSLLSSLLRDSHLSKLPPHQLRGLIEQRADNNYKLVNMLYFNGEYRSHS